MQKKKRRSLYRQLSRVFGHPTTFSDKQREQIRRILDGWRGQHFKEVKIGWEARINLTSPRAYEGLTQDELATAGWLGRHLQQASAAFTKAQPGGHWSFHGVACVPSVVWQNQSRWLVQGSNIVNDWHHQLVRGHKSIELAISPSYHLTVAKHGVARDGRKIVQAIWDHRDYEDIQVWQCRYWDFSCINHSADSWKAATQQEGYVAKTGTHVVVDSDFGKAVAGVKRRTVGHAVRSIIRDYQDD